MSLEQCLPVRCDGGFIIFCDCPEDNELTMENQQLMRESIGLRNDENVKLAEENNQPNNLNSNGNSSDPVDDSWVAGILNQDANAHDDFLAATDSYSYSFDATDDFDNVNRQPLTRIDSDKNIWDSPVHDTSTTETIPKAKPKSCKAQEGKITSSKLPETSSNDAMSAEQTGVLAKKKQQFLNRLQTVIKSNKCISDSIFNGFVTELSSIRMEDSTFMTCTCSLDEYLNNRNDSKIDLNHITCCRDKNKRVYSMQANKREKGRGQVLKKSLRRLIETSSLYQPDHPDYREGNKKFNAQIVVGKDLEHLLNTGCCNKHFRNLLVWTRYLQISGSCKYVPKKHKKRKRKDDETKSENDVLQTKINGKKTNNPITVQKLMNTKIMLIFCGKPSTYYSDWTGNFVRSFVNLAGGPEHLRNASRLFFQSNMTEIAPQMLEKCYHGNGYKSTDSLKSFLLDQQQDDAHYEKQKVNAFVPNLKNVKAKKSIDDADACVTSTTTGSYFSPSTCGMPPFDDAFTSDLETGLDSISSSSTVRWCDNNSSMQSMDELTNTNHSDESMLYTTVRVNNIVTDYTATWNAQRETPSIGREWLSNHVMRHFEEEDSIIDIDRQTQEWCRVMHIKNIVSDTSIGENDKKKLLYSVVDLALLEREGAKTPCGRPRKRSRSN